MRREDLFELAAKITALRAEVARLGKELSNAEHEWDNAVGPAEERTETRAVESVQPKPYFTDLLVQFFASRPGQMFGVSDITEAFPDEKRTTISGTLSKLVQDGKIERPEYGKYQAISDVKEEAGTPDPNRIISFRSGVG